MSASCAIQRMSQQATNLLCCTAPGLSTIQAGTKSIIMLTYYTGMQDLMQLHSGHYKCKSESSAYMDPQMMHFPHHAVTDLHNVAKQSCNNMW